MHIEAWQIFIFLIMMEFQNEKLDLNQEGRKCWNSG